MRYIFKLALSEIFTPKPDLVFITTKIKNQENLIIVYTSIV